MPRAIQLYLNLIDNWTPITPVVAWFGQKARHHFFRNQAEGSYKLKIFGRSFYLYADWLDYSDAWILASPIYDKAVSNYLYRNLWHEQTFLNVGSNIGYFPLMVASWNRGVNVISVEALRRNYLVQGQAIERNGFDIHLERCLVGDNRGSGELSYIPHNSGSGSAVGYFGQKGAATVRQVEVCPKATIPDIMDGHHVDILLMDIQGGEHLALKGAEEMIKANNLPRIIAEHTAGSQAHAYLIGLGYKVHTIRDDGLTEVFEGEPVPKRSYLYLK